MLKTKYVFRFLMANNIGLVFYATKEFVIDISCNYMIIKE